jgi:hypothetical protein
VGARFTESIFAFAYWELFTGDPLNSEPLRLFGFYLGGITAGTLCLSLSLVIIRSLINGLPLISRTTPFGISIFVDRVGSAFNRAASNTFGSMATKFLSA